MANKQYADEFYDKAIRAEVGATIVNRKMNVCPFTVRLAWHTSGTFDKDDTSSKKGGSNGASMRFEPEISDDANAGLPLMQDIIKPVKAKYPELSYADIWTLAGTVAVEMMGGPKIPFQFGRTDDADGANCPANGRLPDAAQGAQHLRDVFYRMGFNDQEIVVLSGAHTFGSCHKLRSGFDGPWTTNPLKFDNEYFTNLLNLEWKPRIWDGPMQFQDPSGELMMLPTDMALIEDEVFLAWVKKYAVDEEAFKADFATTFAKLLSLGCPAAAQYDAVKEAAPHTPEKGYRDCAMHGSVEQMQAIVTEHAGLDVNSVESGSGRTAMHKASLFGHAHVIEYLLQSGATADPIDAEGDTPLHDAAKYGHAAVVEALIKGGADKSIADKEGKTPADLAKVNGKDSIVDMLA